MVSSYARFYATVAEFQPIASTLALLNPLWRADQVVIRVGLAQVERNSETNRELSGPPGGIFPQNYL